MDMRPPTMPSVTRKGLPGAQVSRKQVAGKNVPGILATKIKDAVQDVGANVDLGQGLVGVSNGRNTRKRKWKTIEPPIDKQEDAVLEVTGDSADRTCSPTGPILPRRKRRSGSEKPIQTKIATSKTEAFGQDDSFHDKKPGTLSTQILQSHAQIHETVLSKYIKQTWYKISKVVALPASRIVPGQGEVTNYNFTQMKWHWIKSLVERLQQVTQVNCSVRGWRDTIPYRMGDWNRPDNGDVRLESAIAELRKQQKEDGLSVGQHAQINRELGTLEAKLRSWRPLWQHEPLYELSVVRGMFSDPETVLIKAASTRGELFIRTSESSKAWIDLVCWIEVQNKNMMGYKSRRCGSQWNGYVVTKRSIEQDLELAEQVGEVESMFRKGSCVAVWRIREELLSSSRPAQGKRKRMAND